MLKFIYDPPVPTQNNKLPARAFSQSITLKDAAQTLGVARWHSPADASAGLAQILDLTISPAHQRKGFGKQLLQSAIDQARELHTLHRAPLRRVWIAVEQKTQIHARAFLTGAGFHHVGTVNGLYRDQDLMIYVKSLD